MATTKKKKTAPKKKSKKASKKKAESSYKTVLEYITPEFVEESAKKMTRGHVDRALLKSRDVARQFSKSDALARFKKDGMTLIDMLRDYRAGDYRQLSYWTVSVITFALLYVLNPIDIIPDSLPVIGELDDAMVVSLSVAMAQREIHEYRVWRLAQELSKD
ncbi:MAG: DUF1232 domain-containing protein [bacterium]|nr:DUF1232 domain-containing protein [bacterium]